MSPSPERPRRHPRGRTPPPPLDWRSLLNWLREANEELVVSAMQNQTLADEAAAARADAETANRLKDEFLAMVSHELRTPLTAILGCAHLLGRQQLDPAQTIRVIHIIQRNAEASARIIDDLLDVSRIIGGQLHLDRQPVDLDAVIREALDALRVVAQEKGVTLTFIDHAQSASVAGDAARLTQVIENLVSNAVKFTPRGGRVEVRLTPSGSQVEIQVADTGQGIAPEFLPQIFDLFSQASLKTTRQSGIGLVLALVNALGEGHGASVHADSEGTGQGATFTVRLPALPADALAPVTGPGVTDETAVVPTRLHGVTLLIVEDDPDARDVLRLILELAGAKVEAVGSVAEALRALDDVRPDVLISDIGMPGRDGFALIRHLRAREGDGGRLPAIALTGYVTPEYDTRLREAGFDVYMPKPAEPDDLVAKVAVLARSGRP